MTTDERLEKLERKLARAKRRNRWVLAAVGLGALAWTVMGAAPAGGPSPQAVPVGKASPTADKTADPQPGAVVLKVIRANEFIVEDENGKTCATLGASKGGLLVRDENGKVRAALGVGKEGPGLFLYDANGKLRATLAASKDESGLLLRDEKGKVRVELWMGKEGPALVLNNATGKNIWRAP
jgi:hypothetical protein